MSEAVLNEAVTLLRAGKLAETQKLLEPLIRADPHNLRAWVLLSETVPEPARKRKILEACLRSNPGEARIQQALAGLQDTPPPAGSAQPAPVVAPFILEASPAPKRSPRRSPFVFGLLALSLLAALSLGWMVYALVMRCDIPLGPGACTRVLFVGNSYTYVNDLPQVFAQLARSGGNRTQVDMSAEGGWTLAQHLASPATLPKIKSNKWNYVVLQEQSQTPAVEQWRTSTMFPAARALAFNIGKAGSTPLFFLTWGHRDGFPENGMPDYASMQAQLNNGVMRIATELAAPVAPVGPAWQMALISSNGLDLWQPDGSHPSQQGTYLAACVFYAAIFERSPEGLSYTGGLSGELAGKLQAAAARVVLQNPHLWNLP
jgi:hypothetical protein